MTSSLLRPGGRHAEWREHAIQMICSDLDGTYLEADETVHRDTLAATTDALRCGVRFSFATGRLARGLPALQFETGGALFGPHIVHNGAQTIGGSRPEATDAATTLPPQSMRVLLELCDRFDLYGEFYTPDERMLVSRLDERARKSWQTITGDPDGTMADWSPDQPVLKATLVAFATASNSPEAAELTLACAAADVEAEISTAPIFPTATIVNVTAKGSHKGRALLDLLVALSLHPESVLGIGDGLNDVSMLSVVGTAVAVEGAPRAVVDAAHFVAPAGTPVAVAIRELVLHELVS